MTKEQVKALMQELKFPDGAVADWEGTNHYEIQGKDDPWWFQSEDIEILARQFEYHAWDKTIRGRKLGLILELACIGADVLRNEQA